MCLERIWKKCFRHRPLIDRSVYELTAKYANPADIRSAYLAYQGKGGQDMLWKPGLRQVGWVGGTQGASGQSIIFQGREIPTWREYKKPWHWCYLRWQICCQIQDTFEHICVCVQGRRMVELFWKKSMVNKFFSARFQYWKCLFTCWFLIYFLGNKTWLQ